MSFSPPSRSHCFLNTSRYDNRILFLPHNRLKVAWQPIFIPPAPNNKHNCTLFFKVPTLHKNTAPSLCFSPASVSKQQHLFIVLDGFCCWVFSVFNEQSYTNTGQNRHQKNLYILWGGILTQGLSWCHQRVHSSVSTTTNAGLVGKQEWGMNKRVLPNQPSRHACTCFFYLLWECSGPCTGFKKKSWCIFPQSKKMRAVNNPHGKSRCHLNKRP